MKIPFNENLINRKRKFKKLIFILTILLLVGCNGKYGMIVPNREVKNQFENFEILPDHNYFSTASHTSPRVVIGIQQEYTLDSDRWMPVELTSEKLRAWIEDRRPYSRYFHSDNVNLYSGRFHRRGINPYSRKFYGNNGSDILNEVGTKIGVWYSFIDWRDWATVFMIDEKTVSISLPISSRGGRYLTR
jgi:hypothetical protein